MPGLFGFKFKTAQNTIDPMRLAEKMAGSLVHGPLYQSSCQSIANGAIGVVSSRAIENNALLQDGKSGTAVALYGSLYALMGVPENGAAIARNPLSGLTVKDLYALYGPSAATHLNGDFNFCLNDAPSDRLLLCSDRFGFRHLYVYEDDRILMFAPELKAFLAYPHFDKTLDEHGLADYFNYSYQLGHRTLFRRVMLLPPATTLTCTKGVTELSEYWSAKYEPQLNRNHLDEAVEEGYRRFMQSMARRTAGKRNLIIPLSGGLDSRLITAAAAELGVRFTTATFGFRKSTDVRIARQVTQTLGLPEPVLVEVRPEYIRKYAHRVGELGECSYGSLGMTTIHAFADLLGPDYDGLLNGIYGGHISFGSPYFKNPSVVGDMTPDQFIDRLSRGLEGQRFNTFLGESAMPGLKELTRSYLRKSVEIEWERTKRASENEAFRLDQFFVYNRIRRCMNAIDHNRFFYIDELPFSGYELFDFYHSLHTDLLLDHFLYKEIYKQKFPRLAAIPWQSTGVNLYSKPSALQKKIKSWDAKFHWYLRRLSKGRLNPVSKDKYEDQDGAYRKYMPLKQWINEIILSDRHLQRGYFSREGLLKLIQWEESGGSAFFELSKVAMFELWARRFLDEIP